MSRITFVLLITLFFNLIGCQQPAQNTARAKGLIAEGNKLLGEDARLSEKWLAEYGRLFTPDNRAQFPSNRESFRSSGERLIKLVEESTRLNARAAEKIEQAADLMSDDKTKKGLTLVAASVRKNIEVNDLMKEQMLLASDGEIKDQKLFNEKFMDLMLLIQRKGTELDDQKSDGKKLLGW
jgi:hypothetical protein